MSDPVVYGETEWINVLFHGQSFMLHQVRLVILLKFYHIELIDCILDCKQTQTAIQLNCSIFLDLIAQNDGYTSAFMQIGNTNKDH